MWQNKKKKSSGDMNQALNEGVKAESKMAALRLLVEFGSAAQKSNAFKEIQKIAYCDNLDPKVAILCGRLRDEAALFYLLVQRKDK